MHWVRPRSKNKRVFHTQSRSAFKHPENRNVATEAFGSPLVTMKKQEEAGTSYSQPNSPLLSSLPHRSFLTVFGLRKLTPLDESESENWEKRKKLLRAR